MAWYTDTTNAPKVYLKQDAYYEKVSISTDTGMVGKQRIVSRDEYEWRGLTEAAAKSIATAKGDTNTQATAVKENQAGAWKVVVTDETIGSWS